MNNNMSKYSIEWLLRQYQASHERMISAEAFILEYVQLPWYVRLFKGRRIAIEFLKNIKHQEEFFHKI